MELSELMRRRRMVHEFDPRPIPPDVLDRILESALHAPSAGFSQGLALIVLEEPDQLKWFWETTGGSDFGSPPPVIVIPIPDKRVYLERYSLPDKGGPEGEQATEAGWPVAYWDIDAAMACMLMLLKAVDEGIGGWFFGFTQGEQQLLEGLGVHRACDRLGLLPLVTRLQAIERRARASRFPGEP
jgi:nitroreductase